MADTVAEQLLQRWLQSEGRLSLEDICAKHPEHLDELKSRVAKLKSAIALEEASPPTQTMQSPEHRQPHHDIKHPENIGPYHILGVIGEGGLGTVYKAEQRSPITRIVALKVVKLGMDTREVIARFNAERQALAILDHPNIARVYDAGATETGRPFFVMEHVSGEPITAYCDRNKVSMRARLELFLQVCDAIHHAHTRGIIHRDIKPSNIMVTLRDGLPTAKVIDFGIGKAINQRLTDQTIFTGIGHLIGTPEYMSPEQAEMSGVDVDERSDVYSLGVVLYELLSGALPFESKTLRKAAVAEIQRIIREEDPPTPSTRLSKLGASAEEVARRRQLHLEGLCKQLRSELEWIPLKALRKDRAERYRSAAEMGDDIRNYLAGRPLIAAPLSTSYRVRKYRRRHRVGVLTGAIILAAIFIAAGAIVWTQLNDRRNRKVYQDMVTKARQDDDYLIKLADELSKQPGQQLKRKELLERSLKNYQSYVQLGVDDPALRSEQAAAYYRIGQLQQQLGAPEAAADALTTSLKLRETLLAQDPQSTKQQSALIDTRINLGDQLLKIGQIEKGMTSLKAALEIAQRISDANPQNVTLLQQLGQAQHTLATSEKDCGDLESAKKSFPAAIAIRRRCIDASPDAALARRDLAATLNNFAALHLMRNEAEEAMSCYREARELLDQANAQDPTNVPVRNDLATSDHNLAVRYQEIGKLDDAQKLFESALEIRRTLAAEDPLDVDAQKFLAGEYSDLGLLHLQRAQFDSAIKQVEEAIRIRQKLAALDGNVVLGRHFDLARSLEILASAQLAARKPQASDSLRRARTSWSEVIRRLRDVTDMPARSTLKDAYNSLAWIDLLSGSPMQALEDARKGLEIEKSDMGLLLNLAHAQLLSGSPAKARATYQQLVSASREFLDQIEKDFADLRAAGRDDPQMNLIISELRGSSTPPADTQPASAPSR